MAPKHEAVTFLSATGETISNDPVWLAERTLREAGVEDTTNNSDELREELEAKDRELEALRAKLAAVEAQEELEDEDEDESKDYADVKGKALVDLAKERGISLKHEDGSALKAGEVRAALAAQDQAN